MVSRNEGISSIGYVNVYEFDESALDQYKTLIFNKPTEEWVDFVMQNRTVKGFTHDYDVVYGPVANDRVYVIRTKFPSWFTKNVSADDGWNVIDIYDTNGNYIGSKTVDLPGEANDMFGNKYYRELESLSYDAATDSFTLYFQSPNWGENTVSGNHFSPPHNVVTNVKL